VIRVCVFGITGWTGSAVAAAIEAAGAQKPDVPSGTSRELGERLEDVRRPTAGRALDTLHGPYVAGTLYAILAVRERVGLTRGLDALLA
jgi:dihydrodipicolinate reductase